MVALMEEALKIIALTGLSLAGVLVIHLWVKSLSRKISYTRIFIQIVSQAAMFLLIAYPLWLSAVVATLLVATLFIGRLFCGWICPFGFYMDLASLLRQVTRIRYLILSDQLNRALHWLRYAIFAVLLATPLLLLSPTNRATSSDALFLSGPFNPLRILLGPLVPAVSPWKILSESNLNFPYVDQIVYYSGPGYALTAAAAFVALSIVASFFVRRFWCRFCPTGVSCAAANKATGSSQIPFLYLEKDEQKCTKCGICKRVCTLQVPDVYEQKGGKMDSSMCMLCLRCVEMCPYEGCLKVKAAGKTLITSRNWLIPGETENSV